MATPFDSVRPRLFGIAYRMLGVRADAEDVVQEAWLRWHRTDPATIENVEAWLVTVTTRLSIDRLRAAQAERQAYEGAWLAEPLLAIDERSPEALVEWAGDLSLAFLHVLERLAPEERAAFLLRQVFDHDYAEIAAMLGKSEPAVRQLVHRAGERVKRERPRFAVAPEDHHRLLQRFVEAASTGSRAALEALFAPGAEAVGDSGGKLPFVRGGIRGAARMANLYWAHFLRYGATLRYVPATINGEPGLLRYLGDTLESAMTFDVDDAGRITTVYTVRNPDKLPRRQVAQ